MTEDEMMAFNAQEHGPPPTVAPAAPPSLASLMEAWKKAYPYLGAKPSSSHAPTLGDYNDAYRKFSELYSKSNPYTGPTSNSTSASDWLSGNDAAAQNSVAAEREWAAYAQKMGAAFASYLSPAQQAQWAQLRKQQTDALRKKGQLAAIAALGGIAGAGALGAGMIGGGAGAGGLGAAEGLSAAGTGSGVLGAVDSAAASAAGGFGGLGASSIPGAVNLGSLGGIMETGAGALGAGAGAGAGALGGAGGGAGGFIPGVDSAATSAAGGFTNLGAGSIPSGVDLGSLGGVMETGVGQAGMPDWMKSFNDMYNKLGGKGQAIGTEIKDALGQTPDWMSQLGKPPDWLAAAKEAPSWMGTLSGQLGDLTGSLGGLSGIGSSITDALSKVPDWAKDLGSKLGGSTKAQNDANKINWQSMLGNTALLGSGLAAIQALRNRSPMPSVPDYMKLAEQTAASRNEQVDKQTLANRANQINAQGDILRWRQTPEGHWTQQVKFSDANQRKYNQQNQMAAALRGQILNQQHNPVAMPAIRGINMGQLQKVRPGALDNNLPAMGALNPKWG